MASLDGAMKSLMQGVSQQTPRERLDGQLTEQLNMLSDAVRGLRRRPGMRWRSAVTLGADVTGVDKVFVTSVDVEDGSANVIVHTETGQVVILDESFAVLSNTTYPYLIAPNADSIQAAALRGSLYLCNTSQAPIKSVTNTNKQDPAKTGFAYVKAGTYAKVYNVIVTINGTSYTASHTTASGTSAGDYALITPEYIMGQLNAGLAGVPGLTRVLAGGYLYLSIASGTLSVSTDAGTYYVTTSNSSRVPLTTDLPARLPSAANNMLCSVGASDRVAVWYKFDFATQTWNEAGAWNSADELQNMPISVTLDGTWTWDTSAYEGRLAGNDDSNEDPAFIASGITGIAAYQGRLVLLAGSSVCMSASGKPRRFYRSTTTELLVSDPIGISSGAASTTNFRYAVPFNKDLLLFSASCQAVIPSSNVALTPNTAQIVITSWYASTTRTPPIVAGRSLLYFGPRSDMYAAVLEMVPSTLTDSQYTTNDATQHIPRYIGGDVRQATSSTTAGSIALVGSGNSREVFVQDYIWSADAKVQAAWHRWTLPLDVTCVWFVRDTVYLGLVDDGNLYVVSVEPQAEDTFDGGIWRPFSDLYTAVTVTNESFTVPVHLRNALSAGEGLLTFGTGDASGEAVGFSLSPDFSTGTAVRNTPDGTYVLGVRFESVMSPTPPFVRDENGTVIGSVRTLLTRWEVTVEDTGVIMGDVYHSGTQLSSEKYSALRWSSTELLPGFPETVGSGRIIIPVRANAQETRTVLRTDGPHDMRILSMEYVIQYNPRRRRAT